jgi:predicted phage terminase large subunit-like protein
MPDFTNLTGDEVLGTVTPPTASAMLPEALLVVEADGPQTLTPELLAAVRTRAEGDLYFFAKCVLGFDKLNSRIHRPLCRLLELHGPYDRMAPRLTPPWREYRVAICQAFRKMGVERREWPARLQRIRFRGIQRLMIKMPRSWFKTTLCSIAYPLWRAVRNSNYRSLLAQNTATNARAKGMALARVVEGCELFRLLWPSLLPTKAEKWSEDGRCMRRTKPYAESTFEFVGTRTQVTSRHCDDVIEDDTVAPDKDDLSGEVVLPNPVDIAQAIGWHKLVQPLFDDLRTGRNIIAGTRWFVLDLLRWVEDNEKDFVVFQWAVREDLNGQPSTGGVLVWPEHAGEEELAHLAAALGPYLYSCLFMNTPVTVEQMLFRPDWFRFYDTEPTGLMVFTTVDPAGDPAESKGLPDYNVVLTCGKDQHDGKIYVLDYTRERCSPGRLLDIIFDHRKRWQPVTIGLELVAYEKSLKYWIKQRQNSESDFFAITTVNQSKRSKSAKIRGLQPAFAQGMVWIRHWMTELHNELCQYPLAPHDDLADALAMQLELWRLTPSHHERAAEWEQGPNDFEFCLKSVRQASEASKVAADASRNANWASSAPNLLWHGDGMMNRLRRGVAVN